MFALSLIVPLFALRGFMGVGRCWCVSCQDVNIYMDTELMV